MTFTGVGLVSSVIFVSWGRAAWPAERRDTFFSYVGGSPPPAKPMYGFPPSPPTSAQLCHFQGHLMAEVSKVKTCRRAPSQNEVKVRVKVKVRVEVGVKVFLIFYTF